MRKKRKGFTLIEVVVSIAIVGILSAIIAPSFVNTSAESKEKSDVAMVESLETEVRIGTQSTQIYKSAKELVDQTEAKELKLTYMLNQSNTLTLTECSIDSKTEGLVSSDNTNDTGTKLKEYMYDITDYVNSNIEPIELQSEQYRTHKYIITLTFPDIDFKVNSRTEMVYVGYDNYFDKTDDKLDDWNKFEDDEQDGSNEIYTLFFDPRGGSCNMPSKKVQVGEPYGGLPTPVKSGYTFLGWYTNATDGTHVDTYTQMTAGDKTIYAHWTADTNTKYTVMHWQQNIGGNADIENNENYTLVTSDVFAGKTGETVTPSAKNFVGFSSPESKSAEITADGAMTINYYYTRNKYNITLMANISGNIQTSRMPLLASLKVNGFPVVNNSNSVNVMAYYGSTYELEVFAQGGYILNDNTVIEPSDGSSYLNGCASGVVKDNTVITIGMGERGYSIAYEGLEFADTPWPMNPSGYDTTSSTITLMNPTRAGYDFAGWTGSNGNTPQTSVTIPSGSTGNKSYKANWVESTNTPYIVQHWLQNLDGAVASHDSKNYTLRNTETFNGTTNAIVTPVTNNYKGFISPEVQECVVSAKGDLVVNYYYPRASYKVTLNVSDGIESVIGSGSYLYEEKVTINATLHNEYVWHQWTGYQEVFEQEYKFKMPAENVELTANTRAGEFAIVYKLDGGMVNGNPMGYTKYTPDITLLNPTRYGYVFGGWTGSNGDVPQMTVVIPTGSTGDKEFVANWRIDEDLDGIPDDSQKPVSFKVSNGTWVDGTTEGYTILVNLKDENGNYSPDGSGNFEIPTGMIPNEGFYEGVWDSEMTGIVSGATPKTYTYRFKTLTYYIDFDGNGSTSGTMNPVEKESGSPIVLPMNQFKREGFDFWGWSLTSDGKNTFGDKSVLTGELCSTHNGRVVLYAIWVPKTYEIKYELDGGNVVPPNPTEYNSTTETFVLSNPTKVGYKFIGWTLNDDTTKMDTVTITQGSFGNRTYTAHWEAKNDTHYVVNHWLQKENGLETSYDAENYDLFESEDFYGVSNTLTTPSVKNYDGFKAPVEKSMNIEADGSGVLNYYYTRNKYKVTLQKDVGIESIQGDGEYPFGSTITVSATAKTDYLWDKWTGNEEYLNPTYTFVVPSYDVTLKATTKPIVYGLSYNYDGGSVSTPNPETYTVETETFTLNNPTKVGYDFMGWIGTDYVVQQETITIEKGTSGNKNFVAIWAPISYEIKYELNGGEFVEDNPSFYTIESTTFTLNNPTKQGYDFDGWIESPDTELGTDVVISTGTIGNKTFVAKWTPREDTLYKVRHWLQKVGKNAETYSEDSYELISTEELYGQTDLEITPPVDEYSGFSSPETQTITINGSGSTIIDYYYTRNSYYLTIDLGQGIESVTGDGLTLEDGFIVGQYQYGQSVTIEPTVKIGYLWNNWTGSLENASQKITFTMFFEDMTLSANATAKDNITYIVNHWQQKINAESTDFTSDNYDFIEDDNLTGTTDSLVEYEDLLKSYDGFTVKYEEKEEVVEVEDEDGNIVEEIGNVSINSASIKGDGSLVIDIYYTRNVYYVQYDGNGADSGEMDASEHYYGVAKKLNPNEYTRKGYKFIGWCANSDGTGAICSDESVVVNLTSENNAIVTLYACWDQLPPGLYNTNDEELISWNDLMSLDYASFTFEEDIYDEEGFWNGTEERTRAILTVEDGVLKSSYGMDLEEYDYKNFSADYLNGKLVLDNNIVEIGEDCFNSCIDLTGIEIKNSVTKIGPSAFYKCTFERIELPNSITEIGGSAFGYCSNISEIIIPDSVISIGSNAFYNCTNLENVKLSNNLTSIENYTFQNCSSLTSITIPINISNIGVAAFTGCTNLTYFDVDADNQTYCSVDGVLFTKDMKTLVRYPQGKEGTTYVIPSTVEKIEKNAFSACKNLEFIDIPSSVNTIESGAFSSCSNLKQIELPNGITTIGDSTFSGCKALESINIPTSVTSIGNYAFNSCSSLTSIDIPSNVLTISSWAFEDCSNIKTATLHEGLQRMQSGVFWQCYALESIVIPNSVTYLGPQVFYNCTSLKEATIGTGIATLDQVVFQKCSSLKTIVIPANVTTIQRVAFYECTNLETVYIESTSMTFYDKCFYKTSGPMTTFYFRNSTIRNKLTTSYYNSSYGTKSTNYSW